MYGCDIAANFTLHDIEYTPLTHEDQLFQLRNYVIFLDEMDINAWYDNRQDGKVYYQHMMKNCRKNNNVIFMIVQDVSSLPKKMRNLFEIICYPNITKRFKEEKSIHFMGNEYVTDISPQSQLLFQYYAYNDEICRPCINLHRLNPVSEVFRIPNLYYWFDKYNTHERLTELEKTTIKVKRRKKEETDET